jgi:hypothetical protein
MNEADKNSFGYNKRHHLIWRDTDGWLDKFKRRLAMPRDKYHRLYNRWCRMLASKIGREGAGKTIPYDDYVENKKLKIATNKYNGSKK